MKIIKLSHMLHISALSLALGLASGSAFAAEHAMEDGMHGTESGGHMEGKTPKQQQAETMSRDPDLESTTRAGTDDMPGQKDTDPAGTGATRSVPGAPEKGTNPATEPGPDSNQ